ncbi:RHS repeat-associated core domain-containing protein, partial [Bergeyella sp. RCAD1439]|nr:RHS repeat-associated core domain-containing protein [Bergeyella sp. RCAD1439]
EKGLAIATGGIILAPLLPYAVSTGSTSVLATKAGISTIGQITINQNIDLADVLADTFLIPGVSGAAGSVHNFKVFGDKSFKLNTEVNIRSTLFATGTSLVTFGIGNAYAPAVNNITSPIAKRTVSNIINYNNSVLEQGLNRAYDEKANIKK